MAAQLLIHSPAQAQDSQSKDDQTVRLRVLSYNIHHAEGTDGKLDVPRIAKIIRSVNPDIVALQEVDAVVERSQKVDQAKELGALTEMKHVFFGNIDLQGGRYGNAILTRGTFGKTTNHKLPNIDKGEQRGMLDCTIEVSGQSVRVLATHFDHRRDDRERLESIEVANQLAKNGEGTPTLLIGDLNADFDSAVLKKARDVWSLTNQQRMNTIPVNNPQRQIDFILAYPAERWRTVEVKVLENENVASDHLPILAELELVNRPK